MRVVFGEINSCPVLQVDETPVKVLKPDKKGYMWVYHSYHPGKRFVIFDFSLSRAAEIVNTRLESFSGLLQTDGYAGYNSLRQRDDIVSLGCWDHARRKFSDVVKAHNNNKTGKAGKMLEKIAKLRSVTAGLKISSDPFPSESETGYLWVMKLLLRRQHYSIR
jgi:transposase